MQVSFLKLDACTQVALLLSVTVQITLSYSVGGVFYCLHIQRHHVPIDADLRHKKDRILWL